MNTSKYPRNVKSLPVRKAELSSLAIFDPFTPEDSVTTRIVTRQGARAKVSRNYWIRRELEQK